MSDQEESVTITVKKRKEPCQVTIETPGYEIYIGGIYGEIGGFVGNTPVTFYIEPEEEERGVSWFKRYVSVKKDGEVVKGCYATPFILIKGPEVGDCWSVQEISPPSGGIFIPHKGTETGLAFDIDDEWDYGWIDFYGEADRIEVFIDGEHKGVILDLSLIIYLAPGTYRVEQEAAGVRCNVNYFQRNGINYESADQVLVKAGELTIVDVDMYSSPVPPPPQYVLDATIRHFQECGWEEFPLLWSCSLACRKSYLTEEWCYTNKVPEVCGYERATHYWIVTHPGFVFPKTEICEVNIVTPGYPIQIATQPGLTTPRPTTPVIFNCASIPISEGVYECTKYITIFKPRGGILHTCNDAKIVFRKSVPGDWSINEEKSSSCIEVFDIISLSSTNIVLSIKEGYQSLSGYILLSESYIPNTLYLRTPATFDLSILNTGALTAEYKVSVTFEEIDIVHEEMFESKWCSAIPPDKTTTLQVTIILTEGAIEEGRETATYNIYTKLEAK